MFRIYVLIVCGCFRPLAGLSCINPFMVSPEWPLTCSFRPLAGLSCINLGKRLEDIDRDELKFPSPRGVELHKP